MHCPECGSNHIVKNGFTPTDKQKYKCGECQKQFVLNLNRLVALKNQLVRQIKVPHPRANAKQFIIKINSMYS